VSCAAHEIRRSVYIRDEATAFAVIEQRAFTEVTQEMAGEVFPSAGVIDIRRLVNDEFTQISVTFARSRYLWVFKNGWLGR
jgi:hypothetical protein